MAQTLTLYQGVPPWLSLVLLPAPCVSARPAHTSAGPVQHNFGRLRSNHQAMRSLVLLSSQWVSEYGRGNYRRVSHG